MRPLFPTERAFAIMNRVHPLTAVIVLHVDYPDLNEEVLRHALGELQYHMPGLNGYITRSGSKWVMEIRDDAPEIPLIVHVGRTELDYRNEVTRLLNTSIDEQGPLIRVILYSNPGSAEAEIILAFHHSLVDSTVLKELLHHFLVLLSGDVIQIANTEESFLTEEFKMNHAGGMRGAMRFFWSQMQEELRFRWGGVLRPVPTSSHNAVISMRFTQSESAHILRYCRAEGIAVNSLINAALLLATVRNNHRLSRNVQCRTMTFADLRPFITPTPPTSLFGCLIAMLRFTLEVEKDTGLAELAGQLQAEIAKAGRSRDILLFGAMAPLVARLSLWSGKTRMGNSALSFIGELELKPNYGKLRLKDVSAFISNNRFGPEYSGFGKILHGNIGLDCTYLTAETAEGDAQAIMRDVKGTLMRVCGVDN